MSDLQIAGFAITSFLGGALVGGSVVFVLLLKWIDAKPGSTTGKEQG